MAARTAKPKPDQPETVAEKVAEICGRCWPNGWPHLHHSAQCEHGSYSRDPEVPAPEQPPTPDPAETGETGEVAAGDETEA